jgi:hypothetical protein
MRTDFKSWLSRLFAILVVVPSLAQSGEPDFATLMQRVRERVKNYHIDLQRVAWTETVREQALNEDRTAKDKPREFVYDTILRLQLPTPDDVSMPFYLRPQSDLRLVDSKAVKKGTTPKLSDPQPMAAGFLAFVLAKDWRTRDYGFSYAGRAVLNGRNTFMIDVVFFPKTWLSIKPINTFRGGKLNQSEAPQVVWKDDFFGIYGLQRKGRIWVDADSYDVLQFEERSEPFGFKKGRDNLTFEYVMTSRFRAMTFENPSETLMVPDSFERVFTTRGWRIPVFRTVYSFSDFKRFSGDAEIRILRTEDLPK